MHVGGMFYDPDHGVKEYHTIIDKKVETYGPYNIGNLMGTSR